MKKFLGIEIGGTKLQIVVGNENAQIDRRFFHTVDRAAGAGGIRWFIEETLEQLKEEKPEAIGVGFGGPVDRRSGSIWTSYHIGGWSGFGIKDWLTEISGLPVAIDNDANVAALGEALYGAGSNEEAVFYVTLGSGAGSGLVINKKIYHGISPGENEFGHLRLDKTGRILESSCSGWSVNEKIRKAAAVYPQGTLATLAEKVPGAEAKILLTALEQQDPEAARIFDDTIDDLSFGLSHVIHLLHPNMIVLGGGFSLVGEPLRTAVAERVNGYLMDAFQPGPAIKLSLLKEDAVPTGALVLAREHNNK